MMPMMNLMAQFQSKLEKAERMPDPIKGLPYKAFVLNHIPDREIQVSSSIL